MNRFAILASTVAALLTFNATATNIAWSATDSFAHATTIAPGKAAEICGQIEPRLPVQWRFQADGPLRFNIHRHSGAEVIYATKSYLTREQSGKFNPTFSFEWCWMWVNETAENVTVQVDLKR